MFFCFTRQVIRKHNYIYIISYEEPYLDPNIWCYTIKLSLNTRVAGRVISSLIIKKEREKKTNRLLEYLEFGHLNTIRAVPHSHLSVLQHFEWPRASSIIKAHRLILWFRVLVWVNDILVLLHCPCFIITWRRSASFVKTFVFFLNDLLRTWKVYIFEILFFGPLVMITLGWEEKMLYLKKKQGNLYY